MLKGERCKISSW